MRRWIDDCDLHHPCCAPDESLSIKMRIPTRVIDVGKNDNSSTVYLYEPRQDMSEEEKRSFKYIALSHPWGDPHYHFHYVTTTQNLESHKQGISISTLPVTFQDAVHVARQLGIQYVWIDSLCIKQAWKDDDGDFDEEAKHMESVFRLAYFVIAASRAKGTSDGFLGARQQRKFVQFTPSNDVPVYVCQAIDNFQRDIVHGSLNKRGWVLQERVLARRTIYFSETQTYWECGEGIRCETLTKLKK